MSATASFQEALQFLADNLPSNIRSLAGVWRDLPGILRANAEIAQAVSDRPMAEVVRLVQGIRRGFARTAHDSRACARARITCPRCKLPVAALPPAPHGGERAYQHNCPHRRRCSDGRAGAPFPPCPRCADARAGELSGVVMCPRPSPGSIALVMSRRAASALPGLRLAEVHSAGEELVAVVVPAYAVDHLVTGQRLVRYRARSQPGARRAAASLGSMGGSAS